ncbi:MAG: non-heme Fe2+,alpha-ketoglutarate-dependent halogenase [Phenylobacterium sp.]|jgi:non-heme Fe2+,alpha-ketoglutarate-dependent halogenase
MSQALSKALNEKLSGQQIEHYRSQGLLFPIPVLSADEVAYFRQHHDDFDRACGGKATAQQKGQSHLHLKWACDLATHPAILDVVETIIGGDILIHSSTIFCKYPGDASFVSWHQDSCYWGLSEDRLVSAWVALTDSDSNNGCLSIIPATQNSIFDHIEKPAKGNMLGKGLTVVQQLDTDVAEDVILRAGEMSLHHANIVHGSRPNTSDRPRIGFAVRYVATAVKQKLPHHRVILARGEDRYGHFQLQQKPTAGLSEGLQAQLSFDGELSRKY